MGSGSFWVSDEAPDFQNFSSETLGGSTVRMLLNVDDPAAVAARTVAEGSAKLVPR